MAVVAAKFATPAARYNSFWGLVLDFTPTGAVENCIATSCCFHNYSNVFIFFSLVWLMSQLQPRLLEIFLVMIFWS
jgi:hypothetical protein